MMYTKLINPEMEKSMKLSITAQFTPKRSRVKRRRIFLESKSWTVLSETTKI